MHTGHKNLQTQIERFVESTQKAITTLKSKNEKIDDLIVANIANAVYELEIESDQLMRTHDDEIRLEMQIIQNFIHNPVYFSKGKDTKKLSIFHAAKTFRDLKDLSEMKSILASCAGNKEAFKTLITDLQLISKEVIRKTALEEPQ